MNGQLKPFAESIGELCNEWAHLEQWVNRLFLAVGGWDYRLPNALVMSGIISIRDQIDATTVGAINRCPSGEFLEQVLASLNYVNNELRVARNEFVHHIWAPAADGKSAVKVDVTARATKEPGTGIRGVKPYNNQRVTIDEVREVIADIVNERLHLGEIVGCFLAQTPDEANKKVQLLRPPQRLHLLRQREKQRQRDKARAKQKHPQKSSRG